jgi:hypothetical protein
MISFPYTPAANPVVPGTMPFPADPLQSPNGGNALTWNKLCLISDYDKLGYGKWTYINWPLPVVPRLDIMPTGYGAASVGKKNTVAELLCHDRHPSD